jgi:hypothetical protein
VLASVAAGGLSFAGVVTIFDRATAATPVDASAEPAPPQPLRAAVAEKPPPSVTPVLPDAPVEHDASPAESAVACSGLALVGSASAPKERVPLRVHSGAHRAQPSAAQGWLWLERDAGREELADREIVSPYPSELGRIPELPCVRARSMKNQRALADTPRSGHFPSVQHWLGCCS